MFTGSCLFTPYLSLSKNSVTWPRSNYITKNHVISSCGLYVQECHPLAIYYKAGYLAKIIVVLLCGPWPFSWYHVPSTLFESPNQLTPFNCTPSHTHKRTGTQPELWSKTDYCILNWDSTHTKVTQDSVIPHTFTFFPH